MTTVAVWMVTYNHEQYIRQAVESVMMQKTSFPFKIIIGDDYSTDNTRTICRELQERYKDRITLILQEKNTGGPQNTRDVYKACFETGAKYIALLECDDYWTDPLKLQKQYEFMEANADVLLCGHMVKELNEATSTFVDMSPGIKTKQGLADFASVGCNGVYTCSIFFRNTELMTSFLREDWFPKLDGGDHVLLLLATLDGKYVHVLPEVMGVYRKHGGGIWTSATAITKAKGGLLNNYLYKKHLPLKEEDKKYFDWNDRRHFTQLIYAQKRPLPKVVSKVINKILSAIPDMVGIRAYSAFLHAAYSKAYRVQFEDQDG